MDGLNGFLKMVPPACRIRHVQLELMAWTRVELRM